VFDGPVQTDTILTIPADAVARDALLRRLGLLAGVDHPRVEPVGAAVARPDGALVVPRGAEHATDLATILSVRGRCTVAEASGIAVDVAQGLAALHGDGIVQGPLDVQDVVIGIDGRASLRPRLDLPAPGATDADDVHLLARLVGVVVGAVDGDELVALRAALAPALADDARVRPEAGTLAARVHAAVPPDPVRVPEPSVLAAAALARRAQEAGAAGATHRRARRASVAVPMGRAQRRRAAASPARRGPRSWWRTALVAVGVGGAVCLMTAVGLRWAEVPQGPSDATTVVADAATSPAQSGPSSAPPAAVADDVAGVLDPDDPEAAAAELTRRRVAMVTGERAVDEVARAGSPAHRAAVAEQARAEASGTTVLGAVAEVDDVRVSRPGDDAVEVEVAYTIGPHEQVSADGAVLEVPRGDVRTDTLRLVWTDEGWRVTDVL
jgi:hypothetical protein